jgi:hypothetical protein
MERRGDHPPTQHPGPSLALILCITSSRHDFTVDEADEVCPWRRIKEGLELAPFFGKEKARDVAVEERQTRAATLLTIRLKQHWRTSAAD